MEELDDSFIVSLAPGGKGKRSGEAYEQEGRELEDDHDDCSCP